MNGINKLSLNYICRTVTELPGYLHVLFSVPEGQEITAGEVYKANVLDTNLRNVSANYQVYVPETVAAPWDDIAIVINNGFETLEDGRRPEGQPDYTQYTYKEGEVISAIRLTAGVKLELSPDALGNLDEFIAGIGDSPVGTYLYPVGGNGLYWTKDFAEVDTNIYLYVEGMKWFRLGGESGSEFAYTLLVRVRKNNGEAAPVDPDITGFTATVTEGLQVGSENVNQDSVVAELSAVGGTEPYTYSLPDDPVEGADNSSFEVRDANIVVAVDALDEAKTYKVYAQVTDSKGKTKYTHIDIPVAE